jgi:predicted RNA binding protein YcfA (HicA-like mRNA interferase family)
MKTPRGVSADRLIRALDRLGYKVVRQKGSHVRLRHEGPPVHLITIPQHTSLKIGTLHAISNRGCSDAVHHPRIADGMALNFLP